MLIALLTCCQIIVCANDRVQIRLHELEDDINILEPRGIWWQHDVLDLYHVWMLEEAQELDLSEDASRISYVVEHVLNALDSDLLSCQIVYSSADGAIAARKWWLRITWRDRAPGRALSDPVAHTLMHALRRSPALADDLVNSVSTSLLAAVEEGARHVRLVVVFDRKHVLRGHV